MNLLIVPALAVKALRQNMMRSALTMLGIIIGVSAVICVVAIGEGASATVERAITNIGANMVWVESGGVNRNGVRTRPRPALPSTSESASRRICRFRMVDSTSSWAP
jgi:putative ABC transport system permease protein